MPLLRTRNGILRPIHIVHITRIVMIPEVLDTRVAVEVAVEVEVVPIVARM